jgi:hypothetical protein
MSIIEQIAAAIDSQDYRHAAHLTEMLLAKSPQHPWGLFYVGRLHEVNGRNAAAEAVYRQLLQETTIPKVALQARQSLQRLELTQQTRRKQAIADATRDPSNATLGFFIVEPITGEARIAAAQNFARIMKLDPYGVRLILPSKGWQLYRTGAIGELQVYQQELQAAEIPAFCASLETINAIPVYRIDYIADITPDVIVMCRNADNQQGSFRFHWSEVSQRVSGQVPVFEKVLDRGVWGKLERKERTQDYVQFYDLHLHSRRCILRLCDHTYQFQDGVALPLGRASVPDRQATARIAWNHLLSYLGQTLAHTIILDNFRAFGETTIDHRTPLSKLKSNIDLTRKIDTHWDAAFQLYSALAFLKASPARD